MSEVTQQPFQIGVQVANALEVVKSSAEPGYKAKNWDLTLGFNRYEGKNPSGIVDEFVSSGANESQLGLLVESLRNSYPNLEERPDYVKSVLKVIEDKLNPKD